MANGQIVKANMLVGGPGISVSQTGNGQSIVIQQVDLEAPQTIETYPFILPVDETIRTVEFLFTTLNVTEVPEVTIWELNNDGSRSICYPDITISSTSVTINMNGFSAGNYVLRYTKGEAIVVHRRDIIVSPTTEDENGNIVCLLDDELSWINIHNYQQRLTKIHLLLQSEDATITGNISISIYLDNVVNKTLTIPVTGTITEQIIPVNLLTGHIKLKRNTESIADTLKTTELGLTDVVSIRVYDIWVEQGVV